MKVNLKIRRRINRTEVRLDTGRFSPTTFTFHDPALAKLFVEGLIALFDAVDFAWSLDGDSL